nr:tRNA (guanosine(37)-N1)-methyltransferase TrmD [uncultured Anaeromusa sp.]
MNSLHFSFVSLFPEMFAPLEHSILKRARDAGLLSFSHINPRDFALDKHRIVDDTPFGGGAGMVMKPDPIYRAVQSAKEKGGAGRVVLMCPGGTPFSQAKALELAEEEHLILVCGHYEGIDERIRQHVVDEVISIGDYVLTGGELPAMVVADAVARLVPGVLGSCDSAPHDSFYDGLLEYPQYTRPRSFNDWEVPEVLVSGDHAKIQRWRRKEALRNTWKRRPDLLSGRGLEKADAKLLAEVKEEEA